MFKLLCILKCIILVTSNPLQGLQSCPLAYQHNYGQTERSVIIPTNNFNPYQQQLLVQNQLTPQFKTIPHSYNEQIKRTYLDKLLSNPIISSFVDENTRVYDQNGIDITRYISNPTGTSTRPSVVNNYIIVPPEYLKLNQNISGERCSNTCTTNIAKNNIADKNKEYSRMLKNKQNVKNENIESKSLNTNKVKNKNKSDNSTSKKKIRNQENQASSSKRKFYKNSESKSKNNAEKSTKIAEDNYIARRKNKNKYQSSKLKKIDYKNNKNSEEYMKQKSTTVKDDRFPRKTGTTSKTNETKTKIKSTRKKAIDSNLKKDEPHENLDLEIRNKPKDTKKTADVEVCFDINEDCTNLESRRTRNNWNEPRNNFQQQFPKEFPMNIATYLNSIMSNQQLNTNFFNPFVNYPYNFDYIYQMPQQSSTKSNGSSKRRKNKKRKQKTNNSTNIKQKSNKNQNEKVVRNDCKKVVELSPQYIEVKESIKPVVPEVTPKNTERHKFVKEAEPKEIKPIQTIIEPLPLYASDDSKEILYNDPILGQDFVPFLNDNGIMDEYYPDFTSDNVYLSKEEYEFNNYHDRYYYTSDKKAEVNREKRKYERINGKDSRRFNDVNKSQQKAKNFNNDKDNNESKAKNINDGGNNGHKVKNVNDNKVNQQCKDNFNNENSSEVKFRTPPALEFPDFKTEMINKDRYNSRTEIYYQPDINDRNHKNKTSINSNVKRDRDNEIETVYARSKVVKYGASPNIEEKSSILDFSQTDIGEEENLISRDGETTIVIARSLGQSENY